MTDWLSLDWDSILSFWRCTSYYRASSNSVLEDRKICIQNTPDFSAKTETLAKRISKNSLSLSRLWHSPYACAL